MLDDHLVKTRALLDYKKGLFGQVAITVISMNKKHFPKLILTT